MEYTLSRKLKEEALYEFPKWYSAFFQAAMLAAVVLEFILMLATFLFAGNEALNPVGDKRYAIVFLTAFVFGLSAVVEMYGEGSVPGADRLRPAKHASIIATGIAMLIAAIGLAFLANRSLVGALAPFFGTNASLVNVMVSAIFLLYMTRIVYRIRMACAAVPKQNRCKSSQRLLSHDYISPMIERVSK